MRRGGCVASLREETPSVSLQERRIRRVSELIAALPSRYLGAARRFDKTLQVRLGDVGRMWEIRARADRCDISPSPARDPDVVIGTDAATLLALYEGRLSGIDAFAQGRLDVRGELEMALLLEGMFELPGGRPPLIQPGAVETPAGTLSTLVSGAGGEQVICLHGLGAHKLSFYETISALTPTHTVHAIDLPGFGSSSKPLRGRYDAAYFARSVLAYMDAAGIDHAHLIGNSMGGRIAIELALLEPERVGTLSLLSPSLAFRKRRGLVPLVKLLRPELASIPHPLRSAMIRQQLRGLFAQPEHIDPSLLEVAAEEFCRTYRSRAARIAFFAAARNLYLDTPWGERGLWSRLRELRPPALFIWGEHDRLVPAAFARHVAEALPAAHQIVFPDCGHVPQIELPERTHRVIRQLIASRGLDRAGHRDEQRAPIRGPVSRVSAAAGA